MHEQIHSKNKFITLDRSRLIDKAIKINRCCASYHIIGRPGHEVVAYESPRPTAGIHRFVFIVFRQVVRQAIDAPGWRANFNTRDFAACYSLGAPVAGAYFNCQREGGCGGRRYR
jgi:hypothetical protein